MRQCARTIKSLLYITVTILSAHNSILVITIKKYLRSVILTISRAAGIINNNTKNSTLNASACRLTIRGIRRRVVVFRALDIIKSNWPVPEEARALKKYRRWQWVVCVRHSAFCILRLSELEYNEVIFFNCRRKMFWVVNFSNVLIGTIRIPDLQSRSVFFSSFCWCWVPLIDLVKGKRKKLIQCQIATHRGHVLGLRNLTDKKCHTIRRQHDS